MSRAFFVSLLLGALFFEEKVCVQRDLLEPFFGLLCKKLQSVDTLGSGTERTLIRFQTMVFPSIAWKALEACMRISRPRRLSFPVLTSQYVVLSKASSVDSKNSSNAGNSIEFLGGPHAVVSSPPRKTTLGLVSCFNIGRR